MKRLTLLLISFALLAGCSSKTVDRGYAVIESVDTATSLGTPYTVWTGLLDMGVPVGGVHTKKIDLRVGDIVVIKQYRGEKLWTISKRVNANR